MGYGRSGKGKAKINKESKWQIMLGGEYKNYGPEEDRLLKRAFLIGQPNVKFSFRGQKYEYNFQKMKQINLETHKDRDIRPPVGMTAPKQPLLPTGPMVVVTVGTGQAGKTIEIPDPNNPGKMISVVVPATAKVGQKMAVPVPAAGESIEKVQEKQKKHWSTGGKVAAGMGGAVGLAGLAVGGVVLGDHLTDGAVGDALGMDIGGTVADVGTAVEGAAEDAGEWFEGAAEDVGDWLGDAAEDTGDFIMDLF